VAGVPIDQVEKVQEVPHTTIFKSVSVIRGNMGVTPAPERSLEPYTDC
jgi:hypothetical protein